MSRTLVHRPWIAWFDDPSICIEDHDHVDGPCDLPTLAEWRAFGSGALNDAPWRCGWELDEARLRRCGCHLCTGSRFRRMDRRFDRHRASLYLRTGRWRDDYDV